MYSRVILVNSISTKSTLHVYYVRSKMKILYIFFSIVMHYIATVKCHLSEMKQIISTKSVKLWLQLASDFYLLTTLTMVIQKNLPDCDNNFLMSIEICARKLCYALHCGRSYLINSETATRQCN